jgi:LPPG:FO 2-phospho-L-lactate transferase
MPKVAVICGGVGAARFLRGLVQVVPPDDITAIVNVGDDLELHGLAISPDIDTVIYTVSGAIDPERGWGLANETWQAMDTLERYGERPWFNLGDRDLATHLFRTRRLAEGATLAQVTGEIARGWGLGFTVLPVTNDRLRTMVTLPDEGDIEVTFQEYFVKRQHGVRVSAVRFADAHDAKPAPGVLEAIETADVVVIAPSNPLVSIDPVLAVPAVRDAIVARRDDVVAISPIIAGAALKGPADRMMTELGYEASASGVAALYAPLAAAFVLDDADEALAEQIETSSGLHPESAMRCGVTPTIMKTPELAADLARTTVAAVMDRKAGA